jgi:hypothetical protein
VRKERLGAVGRIAVGRDPDAGRDAVATTAEVEWLREAGEHPPGDQDGLRAVTQAVEEHRELVTAQAPKEILAAHHGSNSGCYFDEQLVTRAMPERVVDELEVIEIEIQDADEGLVATRGCYRPFELLHERAAVGKTRQAVPHGLVA